jgi:hypothetical protein
MATTESDLGYLNAGLASLESYLLSDDIYWNLRAPSPPGEPAYPQLTLGNLLLARARLAAWPLSPDQSRLFSELESTMEAIRTKWRAAWTKKAEREFGARLRLWRDFLDDYRRNPETNLDRYPYEVSRRVMLHLLESESNQPSKHELELLEGLDKVLSAIHVPGEFIWDQELRGGFPPQKFPYLYGTLKS